MPKALPTGVGLGLHWAWVPLVGFIFGAATLISLLVIWLAQGHPRYKGDEATVVYISDVGADNHALFIVLGSLTAVFFFLAIYLDFQLRHKNRIPIRVKKSERAASALSVIFAFICAVGCILLTIFDAFNHSTLHWTFSGIFFVALLLSGLFNMVEIGGLARHYKDDKLLRASFIIKLCIVVPGIAAIIVLGVLMRHCNDITPQNDDDDFTVCNVASSSAAALEWFVATLFCIYIGSIIFDLYPARYTSKHRATEPQPLRQPTNPKYAKNPTGTTTNGSAVPMSNGASMV